ncbi:50S ribosomal protein L1 [Candidatus Desantisbacteria bacterium CG1_02_38_46]|uniref:Ribosomal protein n=3 Tax=unclassified Candidatus Desantisiibacteriota TaxID=3106372 RepID=A0A2H9PCH1_9BACT|nr:MAG: 50S ribosomal protein L1 [Candidatus Desantisbacteria bacterium CG1_02_38_46]PIU51307.1 MAG: 50S ribosomal protein L1 [Candidatus Desantisbacteria bacterium CG07_land_8_20_14_0_80_39_15]PIZ16931.1 MAG: 50S ribosomal protein L1 [Candidatus Desantisbacteria bacterium CG_4_10_14_0_8_um_filter_39_17]
MKRGKRYRKIKEMVDSKKLYPFDEALGLTKDMPHVKFDETVDLSLRLVTGKQKEVLRTTISFPHQFGSLKKILVFAKGEKVKEAQESGADFVGAEDLAEKITGGWVDFDVVLATPETMPIVTKLGRILGPKGLMPNPKNETVTSDLPRIIKEIKGGRREIKMDEAGIIQVSIGKRSHSPEQLKENSKVVFDAIMKLKPLAEFKSIILTSTMGPRIKIEPRSMRNEE